MSLLSKRSFVGIDLGHHALKAVTIERAGSGWRITRAGVLPTPQDAMKEGVVVDPELLAGALRALLKQAGIGASTAYIAVSGNAVQVRPVRMPKMAEATLRKSIKFEASRYVPTTPDESYIEFEILGPADNNQMDVLVVSAPKDIVNSRIAACNLAGLEVEAVDIEAFALYRSLIEADQQHDWSHETLALVDVGAATTGMSVVNRGTFAMTRSLTNGGQAMTDVIKNYFKLSDEDAEVGKSQLNLRELIDDSKPHENPPLRVVQPQVDDLVREVRRSLNYYQSQQSETGQGTKVETVLLTGNGARMPGLADYVGHKLGVRTLAIGVFDNPRFTATVPPNDNGEGLGIAAGLAMRGWARTA